MLSNATNMQQMYFESLNYIMTVFWLSARKGKLQ